MLNKFLTKPFLSDQILYDELKELQWSDYLSNSRPRHEQLEIVDKCGKSHIKSCCDELYFQVLKDKMKYIRRECYRQIRHNHTFTPINPLSCESITRYREDVTCLAECVAKKKGVMSTNNSIIISKMQEVMKHEFSTLHWLYTKIDEIVFNCIKHTLPQRGGGTETEKDEIIGCNTTILDFSQCIWTEIQLQCPQERIKDEKKCQKIREGIISTTARV
ncbi:PBP/GOBP family [Popillia japonica]|uniref:PBP/GOBP family n=1 Tax=Popillia japonica TaxID=7064 RepID=A0AAW1LQQ6_POPJA